MALIIPEGTFAVVVRIDSPKITDGFAVMTFGVATGVENAETTAGLVAQSINTAGLDNMLSDQARFSQVTAYNDTTTFTDTVNIPGVTSAAMPPPNVAMLVKKNTPSRGRRGQGRFFLPMCVPESAVDDAGVIDTTSRNVYQGIVDDWHDELDTIGIPMVLLQGDEGQSAPLSPPPFVTSLQVDAKVATQRRRLRR